MDHAIVSREEWLDARKALLAKERAMTHELDALRAERRQLPWVRIDKPYVFEFGGHKFEVDYEPGESTTRLFGGNSNWRGPIWMPVNYLLVESLYELHHYYGDDFTVECPVGSGKMLTLRQVAEEISSRLCNIFLRDDTGRRPVFGDNQMAQNDPAFRDHVLFHEYFAAEPQAHYNVRLIQSPRPGPGCAARIREEHQSEQAGSLAFLRDELLQHPRQPDRFGREVGPIQVGSRARGVALVEHQIKDMQHHAQPFAALGIRELAETKNAGLGIGEHAAQICISPRRPQPEPSGGDIRVVAPVNGPLLRRHLLRFGVPCRRERMESAWHRR